MRIVGKDNMVKTESGSMVLLSLKNVPGNVDPSSLCTSASHVPCYLHAMLPPGDAGIGPCCVIFWWGASSSDRTNIFARADFRGDDTHMA